jgi:predicted nucleic acid-binding protein
MHWAILDTNVYIGHWEQGLYEETLAGVRRACIVRHSAVVLSELRRGARTREAERLVTALYQLARMC